MNAQGLVYRRSIPAPAVETTPIPVISIGFGLLFVVAVAWGSVGHYQSARKDGQITAVTATHLAAEARLSAAHHEEAAAYERGRADEARRLQLDAELVTARETEHRLAAQAFEFECEEQRRIIVQQAADVELAMTELIAMIDMIIAESEADAANPDRVFEGYGTFVALREILPPVAKLENTVSARFDDARRRALLDTIEVVYGVESEFDETMAGIAVLLRELGTRSQEGAD